MGSGKLIRFALHLIIIAAFVIASRSFSHQKLLDFLQVARRTNSGEDAKAAQNHPPKALRVSHPVAYDKACKAIERFEGYESKFLHEKNHRTRTYYNAIEQSSRCMKHLFRLKRALPNDLEAENRLDYFMDHIQDTMATSLIAMKRCIHGGMQHATTAFPFASNRM